MEQNGDGSDGEGGGVGNEVEEEVEVQDEEVEVQDEEVEVQDEEVEVQEEEVEEEEGNDEKIVIENVGENGGQEEDKDMKLEGIEEEGKDNDVSCKTTLSPDPVDNDGLITPTEKNEATESYQEESDANQISEEEIDARTDNEKDLQINNGESIPESYFEEIIVAGGRKIKLQLQLYERKRSYANVSKQNRKTMEQNRLLSSKKIEKLYQTIAFVDRADTKDDNQNDNGNVREIREGGLAHVYDVKTWRALVEEAMRHRPIEEFRQVLEGLLCVFPTAREFWFKLAEAELIEITKVRKVMKRMQIKETVVPGDVYEERIKSVFSRSLLICADVEMWCLYIKFIQESSDQKTVDGIASIRNAYEYTLSYIGQDIDAGPIWQAYILFLRSASPKLLFPEKGSGDEDGPNALQVAAHNLEVRTIFHRALVVPSEAIIENIWDYYEKFENSVSKTLAKQFVAEVQPQHVAAKAIMAKRRSMRKELGSIEKLLAVPPSRGGQIMEKAMKIWTDVLAFEVANDQRVDKSIWTQRVKLVFEQGFRVLYLVPAWWICYGRWLEDQALYDDAMSVWERATAALPACLALQFAKAECEEMMGNIEGATHVFTNLVTEIESDAEQVAQVVEVDDKEADETLQMSDGLEGMLGKVSQNTLVYDTSSDLALVYIKWMQFARRAQSLDTSRQVFQRARKCKLGCPWQVYVGNAHMEWAFPSQEEGQTERVCRNIFELGLKQFLGVTNYVLSYAKFLEERGDYRNARALFERAIANTSPGVSTTESRALWDAFVKFENNKSSLSVIKALQVRRRNALGIDTAAMTSREIAKNKKANNMSNAITSCYDYVIDCESLAIQRYEGLELSPIPEDFMHTGMRKVDIIEQYPSGGVSHTVDRKNAEKAVEIIPLLRSNGKEKTNAQNIASQESSITTKNIHDGLTMLNSMPLNPTTVTVPPLIQSMIQIFKSTPSQKSVIKPPPSLVLAVLLAPDMKIVAKKKENGESPLETLGEDAVNKGQKRGRTPNQTAKKRVKVGDASTVNQNRLSQISKPPVHDVFRLRQQQRTKDKDATT